LAAGEQMQPIVQPRCQVLYPERRAAGRRQLDRQWDAIEAPANCRHDSCNASVRREARISRPRPRDEKLDRAMSQHVLRVINTLRRHAERRHPVEALTLCSQGLTARRQHTYSRVGTQQSPSDVRCGIDDVLAIIQHQHQRAGAESIRDPLGGNRAGREF
jgi:hypothetical protein